MDHEKYVRYPITNKTGKLNVKIKASFWENVLFIDISNTLILKEALVMNQIYFKALGICI